MAEQADKESKTEEATEKKIRDAVEKGQLPFAKEVPVVGSFLAILVFLIFIAQSGAIELAVMRSRCDSVLALTKAVGTPVPSAMSTFGWV